MHRRWRAAGLLAAMAVVTVACGDDGANGPDLTGRAATTTTKAAGIRPAASTTTAAPASTTTAVPSTPTVFTTTPPGSVAGPARLSEASTVSTAGLAPLTFGLTVSAAEKAIGSRLLPDPTFTAAGDCIVVKAETGPEAVWFTVTKSTVERLDIRGPSKVKTVSGAGVTSTEAQLKSLFADRLVVTSKPQGKTAVFTPVDGANANFRVIFELDLAGVVTSYRVGRVGAVEALTPCT